MECQQPRQPLQRNMQQKVTSSLSEVETDSQGDVVDRVVGSSPSTLSDESSPETDFIPESRAETLPPSKYGRKGARVERKDYASWEKMDNERAGTLFPSLMIIPYIHLLFIGDHLAIDTMSLN